MQSAALRGADCTPVNRALGPTSASASVPNINFYRTALHKQAHLGDYEERFCRSTNSLHIPQIFCIISPVGSSCRTVGINHFPIAQNQSFRASHVSIVSRLRSLNKCGFSEIRMTQRLKNLLDQVCDAVRQRTIHTAPKKRTPIGPSASSSITIDGIRCRWVRRGSASFSPTWQ